MRSLCTNDTSMHKRGSARGKQGPALPFSISQAVNAHEPGTDRNAHPSKAYALKDRKALRKAKRQQKGKQRHAYVQHSGREQPAQSGQAPANKRQRADRTTAEVL